MARVLAGKALMAALLYRYAPRITADFARVAERGRSDGVRVSEVAFAMYNTRGNARGCFFAGCLVSYVPLAHAEAGYSRTTRAVVSKRLQSVTLHRFS